MNESTEVVHSDTGTLSFSRVKEQTSGLCNNMGESQNLMLTDRSHTQKLKKIFLMKSCAYKCYTSDDWKDFPEQMLAVGASSLVLLPHPRASLWGVRHIYTVRHMYTTHSSQLGPSVPQRWVSRRGRRWEYFWNAFL